MWNKRCRTKAKQNVFPARAHFLRRKNREAASIKDFTECTGAPFVPFGIAHAMAAFMVITFAFAMPLMTAKLATARQQGGLRFGLTALIAVQIALNIWVRVEIYGEPLKFNLPLHLCGVSLILNIIILLFKNYRAYEVGYFWALAGGVPAVLMPDVEYTFPHPFFVLFFTGHGLEITGVIFATVVFGFRPQLVSVVRALAATGTYALMIIPINYFLGTNYLYLRHKPEQPSIIDFLGPWPWYIFGLALIAVLLSFICFLPFAAGRQHHRGNK